MICKHDRLHNEQVPTSMIEYSSSDLFASMVRAGELWYRCPECAATDDSCYTVQQLNISKGRTIITQDRRTNKIAS